jgi:hypothetical protein
MNWTTDHPTQEGWYWLHLDNEKKQIVIVYVLSADRMVSVGTETEGQPSLQKGVWYGPLEPPAFKERESQP